MEEFPEQRKPQRFRIESNVGELSKELQGLANVGRQFARSLTSAFEGVAIKGKKLGDVLRGLALDLSNMVLKAALKPLEQGVGNLFSGLFQGAVSGAGGAAPLPLPFAKGGVIAAPTTFPLGSGLGLAGERGAEAILPLARGPDGALGVAAHGGAGGGINISFNVTSPDVESFRRSETQVAAMLTRAMSLGGRNM
ncbi:MAG: phage tail tape measure protein [Filomicrobium sp.]